MIFRKNKLALLVYCQNNKSVTASYTDNGAIFAVV